MLTARNKRDPLEDRWMSVRKAAALLGCSRHVLLTRIAKGEIKSDFVAERVIVLRDSVDAALARQTEATEVAS